MRNGSAEHSYSLLRRNADPCLEIKRLNRLRLKISIFVGPLIALVALLTARPRDSIGVVESCGIALLLAGVVLRLWALGSIDGSKKRVLVTWGTYRYLRHPLYCGTFLFLIGFCLLARSLSAGLVSCLAFVALYLPVMRAEERFLAERFGAEWDDYRRQTRALIPKLRSQLPRTGLPFHLRRPLRELGFLVLLLLVTVGAFELLRYLRTSRGMIEGREASAMESLVAGAFGDGH